MKLNYVDGFKIRNTLDAGFGVIGSRAIYSYIPKGEIWFDKLYTKEKEHFLKIHLYELKLMKERGYEQARKIIEKKFRKKEKPPNFVIKKANYKGFVAKYVDGRIIRKYIDPKFILGCHSVGLGRDYLNKFMGKKEIWIDIIQNKREYKYTLLHEWFEAYLMIKGFSYNDAHDYALAAEKVARRKSGARYLKD
ncbi:MAG: hypothetical protein NT076_01975 [Candidatus Pacearchaeota archaeon]|nr:hypothetical protein [Candidatus Pacearchaeota archaeon]